jgi:hypothetical protein
LPTRGNTRGGGPLLAIGLLAVAALLAVAILIVRSQTTSAEHSAASSIPQGTSSEANHVRLPAASEVESAKLFASSRAGRVSFAVVDTSGALACFRFRLSYHSASVVKAMLLVSYLNHLARSGEALPPNHAAYLASMMTIAILTDSSPSDEYGRKTIRGIAARLLGE